MVHKAHTSMELRLKGLTMSIFLRRFSQSADMWNGIRYLPRITRLRNSCNMAAAVTMSI